jgi:hypothetical protein
LKAQNKICKPKLNKGFYGKLSHLLYEQGVTEKFLLNKCVAAAVEDIENILEQEGVGGRPETHGKCVSQIVLGLPLRVQNASHKKVGRESESNPKQSGEVK